MIITWSKRNRICQNHPQSTDLKWSWGFTSPMTQTHHLPGEKNGPTEAQTAQLHTSPRWYRSLRIAPVRWWCPGEVDVDKGWTRNIHYMYSVYIYIIISQYIYNYTYIILWKQTITFGIAWACLNAMEPKSWSKLLLLWEINGGGNFEKHTHLTGA